MNSSQRRSVMFGEKAVIEMDIDPFVSNLDTPSDLKVPPTYNYTIPKYSTQHITSFNNTQPHANKKVPDDDEKKENDARDTEEPLAKKKC